MNQVQYTFDFLGITVQLTDPTHEFKDLSEVAYQIFITAVNLCFEEMKIKNNTLGNLFKYYNLDDIFWMDILYTVTVASDEDKKHVQFILDTIVEKIKIDGQNLFELMKKEYIDSIQLIIDEKDPLIEIHKHNYSCVDIPKIISGEIQSLI